MKLITTLGFLLALCSLCRSEDTIDGRAWIDFDTDFTSPKAASLSHDKEATFRELPISRFSYAFNRLEEKEWSLLDSDDYYSYLITEKDIPEGTRPYLVRAVIRYSIGSRIEAYLEGGTLKVRHSCIKTIEDKLYKSPIIVFLEEEPSKLEIHNHVMAW